MHSTVQTYIYYPTDILKFFEFLKAKIEGKFETLGLEVNIRVLPPYSFGL